VNRKIPLKTIQKEESRVRILNVASRLFRKQGFKATGIDQIMQEAGLTAGAFYAHFKSKNDLFENALEYSLTYTRGLLTKDLDGLTGEAKAEAILKRYCSIAHRDFPEKGCIIAAMAAELHRGNEKVNDMVSLYLKKWTQLISENLDENIPVAEKKMISLRLISRAVGALLLSRMVKGTDLSEALLESAQKL